jgi:hypothetical protein
MLSYELHGPRGVAVNVELSARLSGCGRSVVFDAIRLLMASGVAVDRERIEFQSERLSWA